MAEETSVASAPPAPPAQPSAESSVGNLTSAQARQILRANADAAKTPAPTAEQTTPAATAPETPSATQVTTTETPATTEETAHAEPEATPEDVLSKLTSLDPKTKQLVEAALEERKRHNQEQIDKRIGKITAKAKADIEAMAQRAQLAEQALRQQMSQAQPAQSPPANQPPLPSTVSQAENFDHLNRVANDAKQTIRQVEALLYRDDISQGVQIGDRVWSKAELVEAKLNAQATLEDHIPVRARFLQARDQQAQQALQKFPFLNDSSTPEFAEAQAMFRSPQYGWLKQIPNALDFVGNYLVGKKAAQDQQVTKTMTQKPRPSSDQTAVTSASAATPRVAPDARAKQHWPMSASG